MLTALPIVLACAAFQPCPVGVTPHVVSPRTSSPAAIVTQVLPPWHRRPVARPFALDHLPLPRAMKLSRAESAQPPLRMASPPGSPGRVGAAAMAVLMGFWAGAAIGAASGDGDDKLFTGTAGALIGGIAG